MAYVLAVGTEKGLFLATSDDNRQSWKVGEPQFPMTAIYAIGVDPRPAQPRLFASVTSSHFGPSVATSDDLGNTWSEPDHAPLSFPPDTGAALERVWQFAAAGPDQPGVVYAGTQPSALFRSTNGGVDYELVAGLWDHPHRQQWGAGFGGQAVHTVLPDPTDPERITVAMSTGGVYRSADGGGSWEPANRGIKAYFLPDPWPEFGQCVHKVAVDAGNRERLYAQNHHGVYRSDDAGDSWLSIAEGLPSDFGFAMVAHPSTPGTVFTFPLTADGMRFPPDHRCRVYRSTDAGRTWEAMSAGLPGGPYFPVVLRDAMCCDDSDPVGVYFGTRSGDVFGSRDEGESWSAIAAHLPDVLCLRAFST